MITTMALKFFSTSTLSHKDGFLISPFAAMSNLFAVGASQHGSFKPVALLRKITTGTRIDTRQTVFAAMPELNMGQYQYHEDLHDTTSQFLHPAAAAFAVPSTLGMNVMQHQNRLVTKVHPAQCAADEETNQYIIPGSGNCCSRRAAHSSESEMVGLPIHRT